MYKIFVIFVIFYVPSRIVKQRLIIYSEKAP